MYWYSTFILCSRRLSVIIKPRVLSRESREPSPFRPHRSEGFDNSSPVMSESSSSPHTLHWPHWLHSTNDISGFPNIYRSHDDPTGTIGTSVIADDTIPPTHVFRTLVLCFDGTGDQFDSDVADISSCPSLSADCRVRTRTLSNSSPC